MSNWSIITNINKESIKTINNVKIDNKIERIKIAGFSFLSFLPYFLANKPVAKQTANSTRFKTKFSTKYVSPSSSSLEGTIYIE